jgi:hypothetical protein
METAINRTITAFRKLEQKKDVIRSEKGFDLRDKLEKQFSKLKERKEKLTKLKTIRRDYLLNYKDKKELSKLLENYIKDRSPFHQRTKTLLMKSLDLMVAQQKKSKARGGRAREKEFRHLRELLRNDGEEMINKKALSKKLPKTKGAKLSKFVRVKRMLNPWAFQDYDYENLKTHFLKSISRELTKFPKGKVVEIVALDLYENPGGTFLIYRKSDKERIPKGKFDTEKIATNLYRTTMRNLERDEDQQTEGSGIIFIERLAIDINIATFTGITGGSYIPLPKMIGEGRKKLFINLKNEDNQCFRWASICSLSHKKIKGKIKEQKDILNYKKFKDEIDMTDIKYPVKIDTTTMKKIEELNPCYSWNIFAYDPQEKTFYPIYITPYNVSRKEFIDLFYYSKGRNSHFVAIKKIESLFNKNKNGGKVLCRRCMTLLSSQKTYENHVKWCSGNAPQKVEMPDLEHNTKKFTKREAEEKLDFCIYADLESFLKKEENGTDLITSLLIRETKHEVASAFYSVVSKVRENSYNSKIFTGEDLMQEFLNSLRTDAMRLASQSQKFKEITEMIYNEEDKKKHFHAKRCRECGCSFDIKKKVRHHDHYTGKYIGALCDECNLRKRKKYIEIPVFFHNLKGYDSHHIISTISDVLLEGDGIEIIAENYEKYKSISWRIGSNVKIVFKDSLAFLSSSLEKLISNLKDGEINSKILKERFPYLFENYGKKGLIHLTKKGIFPYSWFDSYDKFDYPTLPPKKDFYDDLNDDEICDEEYEVAKKIWKEFDCKCFRDYHDLYLKTDVILLSDVFETFRTLSMKDYGLDPAYFITLASFADNCLYKSHGQEIELMTDYDMLLMTEKNIRGGISVISGRFEEANHKYLPSHLKAKKQGMTTYYDKKKEEKWLAYVDANNLYGISMVDKLPTSDYKWEDTKKIREDFIRSYNKEENDRGYILEVDLKYPTSLHDEHADYPLAIEKMKIDKYSVNVKKYIDGEPPRSTKLVGTLYDKKDYVCHISNLKFYLEHGLELEKVKRCYSFIHTPFMRDYIQGNTARRIKSKNEFEKGFYKLMNNIVFGRSLLNRRNFEDIRLIIEEENEKRMKQKILRLTNSPLYEGFKQINEKMIIIKSKKKKVMFKEPIAVGFTILELSKLHMAKLHYDVMKVKYPNPRLKLLFTDTDSFCYSIKTHDFWDDLKKDDKFRKWFDLSNLQPSHEMYDVSQKAKLGLLKIETGSDIMTRFCGLRSKLYSYEVISKDVLKEEKKGKGVKKSVLKKTLRFDDYIKTLRSELEGGEKTKKIKMKGFRTFSHEIYTVSQEKIALSGYDDKRWVDNDFSTLPWGHYSIDEDKVIHIK